MEGMARLHEADHSNILLSRRTWKSAYGSQNKWMEVDKRELRVLDVNSRVFAAKHSPLISLIDLASTHKAQTRQKEAEKTSLSTLPTPNNVGPPSFVIQLRHWTHLKDYLTSEFDAPWNLDNIVVLVSDNDKDTWCTTCKTYIEWRWGFFGSSVLTFVNSILDILHNQNNQHSDVAVVQKLPPKATISLLPLDEEIPSILVQGSRRATQMITDILGWIFDSLRFSDIYSAERYGDESATVQLNTKTIYTVRTKNAEARSLSEPSCWRPLFSGKAISRGPIPERPPHMKGLEIDYSILVSISGVDLPAIEDGGIYLDGLRSALYPIHKDTQSQSLQWHLETFDLPENDDNGYGIDEDDDLYLKSPPPVWYKTRVLNELISPKRHFVGWCTSTVITFGTSMQNPNHLDWSEAKSHKRSVIETTTNLNLNISFHGIGIIAGKSIKRGRTERKPYENHEENLRTALINASKSQVLLFRSSTKQAWLVPKTSVLLQLVQSYMAQLMAEDPELSLPIHFAKASYDGGQSAYQALWNHRNEQIPIGSNTAPCFLFNIVRMFLLALEKLAKSSEPGNVYGWEMRDVIDPPEFFDLKRQDLRWRQLPWLGGWNQLLPEVRLVFFFEGLGDPIIADEVDRCTECMEIPKDRNLLGITMVSLKHFTRRFRSKYLDGSGQLTESCYWDSPKLLFGRGCNDQEHRCSAIQRIIKNHRCNAPSPEELFIGEKGAVIFEPCALSYEETRLRML